MATILVAGPHDLFFTTTTDEDFKMRATVREWVYHKVDRLIRDGRIIDNRSDETREAVKMCWVDDESL